MRSAGSLGDASTGLNQFTSLIERGIPEYYVDEDERWVLAASGWTNFAWDVSPEDESALSQGKVPPSIVSTVIPVENIEAQDEMIASTFFDSILRSLADSYHCDSTTEKNAIDIDAPASRRPEAGSSTLLTQPLICAQADSALHPSTSEADGLTSLLMPVPMLPKSPRKMTVASYSSASLPSSTSSTPTLSPSMSDTSSLGNGDYDGQFSASNVATFSRSAGLLTSSFGSKGSLDLDLNIPTIARSSSVGRAHPGVYFHPTTPYPDLLQTHASQVGASVATIAPTLLYAPALESTRPQSAPGPIRSSVSGSRRTKKPYERSAGALRHRLAEPDNEMICDECGYRQIPGPAATRSYKRHLETHPKYRKVVWICNGATRGEVFRPGCYKQYSRKDALLRHLRTTPDDCDADGIPSGIINDHDVFDD